MDALIVRLIGQQMRLAWFKVRMNTTDSYGVFMTAVRQPRYSKEEFARRGDELYESKIKSQVEEGNSGRIVAIDIETGLFEVADEIVTATNRLFERRPDAQPWIVRIGHRAVHRFGARSLKTTK